MLIKASPPDVRLGKYFSSKEFKCHCCNFFIIDSALIEGLEELRKGLGQPVFVSSGYRCPRHNTAVGGAKNSYHMKGMAADIYVHNVSVEDLYQRAQDIELFNGFGLYDNFIHLDVRNTLKRVTWDRRS